MKSKKKESSTRRGPSLSSTFPAKLHKILSIPELSHIISWMPHGRSWRVLQPKLFEEKVMPKYFAHQSKYASFTRQVNGWRFKRITIGPDRNCYYNVFFLRDFPQKTRGMTRRSSAEAKALNSMTGENPNVFHDRSGSLLMEDKNGRGYQDRSGMPNYAYPPPMSPGYHYGSQHSHYNYPPRPYPSLVDTQLHYQYRYPPVYPREEGKYFPPSGHPNFYVPHATPAPQQYHQIVSDESTDGHGDKCNSSGYLNDGRNFTRQNDARHNDSVQPKVENVSDNTISNAFSFESTAHSMANYHPQQSQRHRTHYSPHSEHYREKQEKDTPSALGVNSRGNTDYLKKENDKQNYDSAEQIQSYEQVDDSNNNNIFQNNFSVPHQSVYSSDPSFSEYKNFSSLDPQSEEQIEKN